MKYTLKNISHFDFFKQLEIYVKELEFLLNSEKFVLNELREIIDKNILSIQKHIDNHIEPDSKTILNLLENRYSDLFDKFYTTYGEDEEPETRNEIERLDRFYRSLESVIGYMSTIETLVDPDSEVEIRDINERIDFVLNKFNSLFGNDFYSIKYILQFNNIHCREGETREIGEDLRRRGYLILKHEYGASDFAKISVKGASFIERKNKQKIKNKKKNELDKKLDNIIDSLMKLGYGQEIIFDEINELRELQHTLSKKSWSQLLKGKLLDLALDKIIDTDTASSIYEYLTNISFKHLN